MNQVQNRSKHLRSEIEVRVPRAMFSISADPKTYVVNVTAAISRSLTLERLRSELETNLEVEGDPCRRPHTFFAQPCIIKMRW